MTAIFFGQHLVETGLISEAQLQHAVTRQHIANPRLGELAVRHNRLTESQTEEINTLQNKQDKRFGDIATELGYLTQQQMEELLEIQKKQHKFIGEILVEEGVLTQQQLDIELLKHRNQRQIAQAQLQQYISEHVTGKLLKLAIDFTSKIFLRILKTRCQFNKTIDHEQMSDKPAANTAHIEVSGDVAFILGINADSEMIINATSIFVRMEKSECDVDLARDALGELLNIILGQMLNVIANDQMNYSQSTPVLLDPESPIALPKQTGVAVEMTSELGSFILFVDNRET